MAQRGGRAGFRGGKPSQSHYPCTPSSVCTSAPEPEGLSPAAPSGASRAPFSSGSGPLASPTLPRLARGGGSSSGGLPQQTCHPTPRKRGPIPAPLCSPAGSALGRRLLPRRAVEVRGVPLGPSRGTSGSVHLARSEPGPFLPCSSRVDSVRSWEAVVLSQLRAGAGECPGRGRVEPAPGGEEVVEAGAPGLTVLESDCGRAAGQAGAAPHCRTGMTRQCSLSALPHLPSEASTRPFGLASPFGDWRAQRSVPGPGRPRGLSADCVWRGAYPRGPKHLPGESSGGRAGASPPWWTQVGSARLRGGRRHGLGRVSDSRAS